MNGDPSTPYSRDLGDQLRTIREVFTTFSARRMARMLGWDHSKVTRIENGQVRATEIDVVQYLGRCGRTQQFIEGFLGLYRSAFDKYYVQTPENLRTIALSEAQATKIKTIDPATIPGLLQTEDYARALFVEGGCVPAERIEINVEARMARQAILRRPNRPDYTCYIHENALRLRIGDALVMEEQYYRLLFQTHSIRIIPESSGSAGVVSSYYALWEFEKQASVAVMESELAQVFIQDDLGVQRCKAIFNQMDQVAWSEEESRSTLADLASRARENLTNVTRIHLA
ncbi:transcriptional regulator [Lentzea sp. NBRC 105346]|uniref:helix-turn-helix domain-containing protein n=1 Tax=Lentzea sp. NBRC 105346 TaxID=3032205 RepID=UPI0024A445D3|nr:helix-turn-helix transcriptional regulator [Lentzea sp. NBRC 105346]GLZ29281.1 transcriptional regulator [Lentzea sp. NBRC 105346]